MWYYFRSQVTKLTICVKLMVYYFVCFLLVSANIQIGCFFFRLDLNECCQTNNIKASFIIFLGCQVITAAFVFEHILARIRYISMWKESMYCFYWTSGIKTFSLRLRWKKKKKKRWIKKSFQKFKIGANRFEWFLFSFFLSICVLSANASFRLNVRCSPLYTSLLIIVVVLDVVVAIVF